MSLADLIYKNRNRRIATATHATLATAKDENGPSVASVATVTVANSKNLEAANDSTTESVPNDGCAGALKSADGGLYLPWGPYLDSTSVNRMRAELVAMVDALAGLEGWPDGCRDDVLARAIRGPLSDLLPNHHYFRTRLDEARTDANVRTSKRERSWPLTGFDDRRAT